jgi:DNA processing protein
MDDCELIRAYLRLTLADGVGAILLRRLLEAFGDIREVPADNPIFLRRVEGIGEKTAAAIAAVTDKQIDEELAEADKLGVKILCLESGEYPKSLLNIYDRPGVLYVRGNLQATDALALGVVGSRRCTYYGLEQAERFGRLLGQAGFTVISGGAAGIDAGAHRGALAEGGRTVAVMGCGLCTMYPRENAPLFEQILSQDGGALISELPMRTAVLGGNFPTRNRIISGLSLAVLIIEAAYRSGSLITAREAADQGKVVFALPGRVDSPLSQGTNKLIRDGAILFQDLDDVLEHLGEVGDRMAGGQAETPPPSIANLDATERQLAEALSQNPMSLDELVRATGIDSGKAASAMTMLAIKGVVVAQAGNMFARKTFQAGKGGKAGNGGKSASASRLPGV